MLHGMWCIAICNFSQWECRNISIYFYCSVVVYVLMAKPVQLHDIPYFVARLYQFSCTVQLVSAFFREKHTFVIAFIRPHTATLPWRSVCKYTDPCHWSALCIDDERPADTQWLRDCCYSALRYKYVACRNLEIIIASLPSYFYVLL